MSVRDSGDARPECPKCENYMVWDPTASHKTHPFKSFITTHVDGTPKEITSLHELRQVERRYGVNFPAYSGSRMGVVENYHNWTDDRGKTHRG